MARESKKKTSSDESRSRKKRFMTKGRWFSRMPGSIRMPREDQTGKKKK